VGKRISRVLQGRSRSCRVALQTGRGAQGFQLGAAELHAAGSASFGAGGKTPQGVGLPPDPPIGQGRRRVGTHAFGFLGDGEQTEKRLGQGDQGPPRIGHQVHHGHRCVFIQIKGSVLY